MQTTFIRYWENSLLTLPLGEGVYNLVFCSYLFLLGTFVWWLEPHHTQHKSTSECSSKFHIPQTMWWLEFPKSNLKAIESKIIHRHSHLLTYILLFLQDLLLRSALLCTQCCECLALSSEQLSFLLKRMTWGEKNPKLKNLKYFFLQAYTQAETLFTPFQPASPREKGLTCSDFSCSFLSVCRNWQFSLASFWTSSIRPMSSLSWSLHITPALRVGEKAKIYLNPQSQDMTPLHNSPYNKLIFSVVCINAWSWSYSWPFQNWNWIILT